MIRINAESGGDRIWWNAPDRMTVNTHILQSKPSEVIESDASNKSWGAVLNSQIRMGGVWSVQEMTHHMNYLEMLAAFLAIKVFGRNWRDTTVLIWMDNCAAVTYINKKGDTCSRQLCQFAVNVGNWFLERNIILLSKNLLGNRK